MYKAITRFILFGALLVVCSISTSTFASTTNDFSVKFIRFYADLVGDDVRVRWVTESEYDNDYFSVERSPDMLTWETLEIVSGSAGSPGAGEYQYIDTEPKDGVNHYRIRQTDFNGTYEFSHIEKVEIENFLPEAVELNLSPNPFNWSNSSFFVDGETSLVGTTVKLIDIVGKEIPVQVDINDTEMTVTPFYRVPGLYFLIIQKRGQSIVKKIKFE